MTRVVHVKRNPYSVYIGRPSKWGNPFNIAHYGRDGCIEKYREWIKTKPELLADLRELKNQTLGCFCKPLACHGDVLAGLADQLEGG